MSDGIDWGYDTDALNVLDKFHQANFVIYVEGGDDICFWSTLLDKAGITDFYIDYAGGIEELEKLMWQIINEDARVIVACDSHYSFVLGAPNVHNRIIRTFGYSIENTMYCPNIINHVIDKLSRTKEERQVIISHWMGEFCNNAKTLLIYDLANEKYSKSIEVMGNKCSRFLLSPTSTKLDDNKVTAHIDGIKMYFKLEELTDCEKLIDDCGKELKYIIKGCFITNGVINLVKKTVKICRGSNPVIPLDNFYALVSDGCKICTSKCEDFDTVKKHIQNAIASVRLI
jgi:hypothetical protein